MGKGTLLGMIFAVGLIVAVVVAITLTPEKPKAEMPVRHVGDEWVYRITDEITYTSHSRVVAEQTEDNEEFYVFETNYTPPYWRDPGWIKVSGAVIGRELGGIASWKVWVDKETGDRVRVQEMRKLGGEALYRRTWTYTYQYSTSKWPLEVGKEYTVSITRTGSPPETLRVKVEKVEDVRVPAGTFSCFRIIYFDDNGRALGTVWYSDDTKSTIKAVRNDTGETRELLSYSIEEGSLVISGPTWLWVGDEATFTVTSRGSPVEGVIVEVDGGVEESDENGAVSFSFARSGTFTVSASKEGYEGASMPVVVTAPSEDALRYEVAAFVTEVIDGDTVDAGIVKLATGLDPKGEIFEGTIETIRFGGGIDAPELEPLEPGGTETTELVENLIPPGTLIYLDLNDLSRGGRTGRPYRGSLERLIAVIYTVIDGRWVNVNAEVLRWGMREYPDHDWLFYRYYPSEWDPDEWLEENYPYVRG